MMHSEQLKREKGQEQLETPEVKESEEQEWKKSEVNEHKDEVKIASVWPKNNCLISKTQKTVV